MLLDTSGLYSYFDKDDLFHVKAVEYFEASVSMLVNNYVLAEFIPLCRVRGLNREKTLAFVEEILLSPFIEKIWTTERHYIEALTLLKARFDKTYSLCDAASFILMREYEIVEALTTDKHFEQEGFVRLLK
jgi:predicted nucleic acid-binding protein